MSYCRFSSDCYQSDVYVYADVNGGWTTDVACRHRHPLKPVPVAPVDGQLSHRSIIEYWRACSAWVEDERNWEWRDIDHPDAAKSFNDATAKECADRLRALKGAGLNVPQYAIDALDAEVGGAS